MIVPAPPSSTIGSLWSRYTLTVDSGDTLTFLKEKTRIDFINDDDGNKLIRVIGPYGIGDLTPQLEFVLEVSDNFEDWEILESIDTDDGVGEMEFNPDEIVQSQFYRVVINEIED